MPTKWLYFAVGILAGFILAAIVFIFITQSDSPARFAVLPEQNSGAHQYSSPAASPSNQGKININSATLEELTALPGIGPSKAAALIAFRNKYGNFESIDELLYVPGFGESLFSSIRDLITVE